MKKKNTSDLMFKFWILIVKIFVVYWLLVLPIKYYSFHSILVLLQFPECYHYCIITFAN